MADDLSTADRERVLKNSGYRCQCTRSTCKHPKLAGVTRCTRKLTGSAKWHAHRKDRSKPHTVANCEAICKNCHEDTWSYGKPKP